MYRLLVPRVILLIFIVQERKIHTESKGEECSLWLFFLLSCKYMLCQCPVDEIEVVVRESDAWLQGASVLTPARCVVWFLQQGVGFGKRPPKHAEI